MSFIKKNIFVLNIKELKQISNSLDIDYHYYISYNNSLIRGRILKKKIIIKNILNALTNKKIIKIIIPNKVVNFNKLGSINKNTKIYYGQYINGNKQILKLMKKLTDNDFSFGVIAQDILFNNWIKGKLLTFKQLAIKWLNYKPIDHIEWQYIEYIRKNGTSVGWKQYRNNLAKKVISKIKKLIY
jgi:hypothetical protein